MTQQLITGDLWKQVCSRTQSALTTGALQSITTDLHILEQDGLKFMVRVAQNLKRKAQDKSVAFNPFLPPDPDLTVADISSTHLSVLNKFNVVENHLLIVTREFQHQERLLTLDDFEALWLCLGEYPSLGFYNGGAAAGASQQHKHLQLVPLPLYPGLSATPFDALYATAPREDGIHTLAQLPFLHSWSPLPRGLVDDPSSAARQIESRYLQMLDSLGIDAVTGNDGDYQSAPYNLLLTTEWMLLIPRTQEHCEEISINALGYVGSLFVKELSELDKIIRLGPMNLLKAVSKSR
ncbi:MAG: hypothetical protein ABW092_18045 [Candidatus Thiodiazotropha sp.]